MRRAWCAVVVVTAVVAGSAWSTAERAGPASAASPVTVTDNTFVVGTRSTPARVGVPASPTRTIHEQIYDPVGDPGALPTVVFAPGWDNQSASYAPLLETIAAAGYLVIGVDSPGSSSYFPGTPYDTVAGDDIGNQALDLVAALDNVEGGPLGGRIDPFEVAAVGHSNGGSAVAALALDASYTTQQFNAYVVLSGGVPEGQVAGTFGAINNGPMLVMVGTDDEYGNYTPAPGGGGTELVYNTAGGSRMMVTINGANHSSAYVFGGAQGDDTRAAIVAFLDNAELHQGAARTAFESDVSSNGLTVQQDLGLSWYLNPTVVGMAATADGQGYWIAWSNGTVRAFGDATWYGPPPALSTPVVAIAGTADGRGYWLVGADGSVFSYGDATYHGGMNGHRLNAPIVGMATDAATGGYWLLGGDGGVFPFDAPFLGSTGSLHLNAPAVGMTATADGLGYYFVASDGGVFSYGDAPFLGSMGGHHLNQPVVGMALDSQTGGYWLDASDGGIFSFGAPFEGSAGSLHLNRPCIAMAADPDAPGYWLVASDGGIFSYGAPFEGSGVG